MVGRRSREGHAGRQPDLAGGVRRVALQGAQDDRKRTVSPPPVVVEALRAHRAEQAKNRLRREPGWTDSELVLGAPHGGPWQASNFDRIWQRFKKQYGITSRFHDLRHTHATQLLKAGVHPKVVSERLGHASIGITLDTTAT